MDNRSGSTSNSSKSYTISPHLSFGTDGCQVLTSQGRRCGEMRTLQIIQEFKNMYETKMKQIDAEAGGDCVQAKINLQQDWIRDLTEQNDMLVRVVEELELEAADRVTMLEEKLQQTSKCACERDKLLKQKNKKIKELEEKLASLVHGGEAEDAFQFKNLSQQYNDLKKDEENKLGRLYEENIKLHKEVRELQVKLVEIRQEIRVATNKFTKAVQTSFSVAKVTSTGQNNLMEQVKDVLDGVEKEKLLVLGVDQEVRTMLKEMYSQEKLLLDQSDLIVILVHKLFVVYNVLVQLEERSKRFFEDINARNKKQVDLVKTSKEALVDIKHLIKQSLDVIEKKTLEEMVCSCGPNRQIG